MRRSNQFISSFLKSFMISLLLHLHLSHQFNIPDQHLTLGKLFYYKLNMTKEQKSDVTKIDLIKISESGPANMPAWLIFHNFTFIGFPVQQDNIKFISIVINYNRHKTLRDVFLINGIDSATASNQPSSHSRPPNAISRNNQQQKSGLVNNCEIRVDKAFESAEDLWKLIAYLMPKYLSELSDTYRPNTNQAIAEWANELFTFSGAESEDNGLAFNLLIKNQPCARDLNDFDDIQYKLTKIGVQFSVVKNVQKTKESTDDEDDQFFSPDHNSYMNDMTFGLKNRRQVNKRVNIYSTPTVYPNWMSISSTLSDPIAMISSSDEVSTMSRVQPSLSTPELPEFSHKNLQYTATDQQQLVTPHYPASVLSNIYSTPSFVPEPPDHFYLTTTDINLIMPTPTLTFIVSDTARELSAFDSAHSAIESISQSSSTSIQRKFPDASQSIPLPDSSIDLPTTLPSSSATIFNSLNTTTTSEDVSGPSSTTTTTTTTSFSTTTTTATTVRPAAKKPKIHTDTNHNLPDHAPMIRERIPKLRLTSGVFWRYIIPEDTFTDFERGNTRHLELSFAPIDKFSENIAPADLFIQFDRENQVLSALPTEDHIGRHKFQLTAADSSGQMVSDELEISVVQHKLSRSFTHKFMFENVVWNADIPLVDAVHNLMKKIATLFKDRNVDSIFLQKVEVVRTENEKRTWNIYWTNSSLRSYPCPLAEIQNIFSKLAYQGSKFKESEPVNPSALLRKTTEPEYQIGQIRVSLASTCTRIDTNLLKDKTPQLRNPIKNITFEIGSVFNYLVPSDTFISSKQTDTRDLSLELVSPSGYIVDRRDCIGFVPENQTIYGLALNERLIDENLDYRLIARDVDSNLNAYDVFVLQILPDHLKNQYTHEITLQFKPKINVEMDLYSKVTIATRFTNAVFDGQLNDVKVLKIRRHRYEPQYKSNNDYNRKRKRDTSSVNSRTFYEYVLSTKSSPIITLSTSHCPADKIERDVVARIFNVSNVDPEARLAMLRELFLPDYELVYVGFRSIGKCKNQISPTYIGTKMVAELKSWSEYDEIFSTTEYNLIDNEPVQPATHPTTQEEVLLRTIVPAILIIVIILVISCLVVILLARCRRNHDKNRFEVNSNMHGVGEAESFLQKARTPVILQSDLNPNMHLLAQQQQVYNPMTPMKQFSRNPYNTSHEPHRRAPPSYMGLNS